MNIKDKIIYALKHPRILAFYITSKAERYLHLRKRAYPYVLQISIDSVCNLNCFFCAYIGRTDKPTAFDINNLSKLKTAIEHAGYIAIQSWGEPLYSPNFRQVVARINFWNPKAGIAVVTNGTQLSKQLAYFLTGCLTSLSISLNAGTAETYERDMPKARWNKTIFAINEFMSGLDARDRSKVKLHFVAHKNNYMEIPQFVELASYLNIQHVRVDQFTVNKLEYMDLSLINVKAEYNAIIREAQIVAQLKGVSFSARLFGVERKRLPCYFPWMATFIWADGRVAPCDENGSYFLGNAYQTSFEDVWFGEQYADFRKHGAIQCQFCPMALPFDNPRAHISPYLNEVLNENPTCD